MNPLGKDRLGMNVVMIGTVWILCAGAPSGRASATEPGPAGDPAEVVVNSQASLRDIVGAGFRDEAWDYSAELLPTKIPSLTYLSGPGDAGSFPKGSWRKPVVMENQLAKLRVHLNCYRRLEASRADDGPATRTPFTPLLEPDYDYGRADFHGLPAATASRGSRDVFVFREGDLLFKVEVIGGESKDRRTTIATTSEAIRKLRDQR